MSENYEEMDEEQLANLLVLMKSKKKNDYCCILEVIVI